MNLNHYSDQDIKRMLNNASSDKVPATSPEFEKNYMKKVLDRKKELESMSDSDDFWNAFNSDYTDMHNKMKQKHYPVAIQWKALIALVAVFVFLIGGTLLTRGKLRDDRLYNSPITKTIGGEKDPTNQQIDSSNIVDASDKKESILTSSEQNSFFQDMGLFIHAALPYLAILAGFIILYFIIYRKRKAWKQ